jgi:hypothetical protein
VCKAATQLNGTNVPWQFLPTDYVKTSRRPLRDGGYDFSVMAPQLTDIAAALAWPLVVLIGFIVLRRELSLAFARVRGIGAPGDLQVVFEAAHARVAEIIEDSRQNNVPAKAVAEHILRGAMVIDKREARIIRALVDDDGREIRSYQAHYRSALQGLLARGYVELSGEGFALTMEGKRVAREYLESALTRLA